MSRHDSAPPMEGWTVERRACPFCSVMRCGCPNEPEPTLIPPNVQLGED